MLSPPCLWLVPPQGGISSFPRSCLRVPACHCPGLGQVSCHLELSPRAINSSCHPKRSLQTFTLRHHPKLSPQALFLLQLLPPSCSPRCRHPRGGNVSGAPVLNPHIVPSEHSRVGQEGALGSLVHPHPSGYPGNASHATLLHKVSATTGSGMESAWGWQGLRPPSLEQPCILHVLPPSAEGLGPSLLSGEVGTV